MVGPRWAFAAVVAVVALAGCANRSPGPVVPERLAGLPLVESQDGTAAQESVDRLHGKTVSPQATAIRRYDGGRYDATLYVSSFASDAEAAEANRAMVKRMGVRDGAFEAPHEETVEGVNAYVTVGMGQKHAVFAAGSHVYWLAADYDIFDEAFRELARAARR